VGKVKKIIIGIVILSILIFVAYVIEMESRPGVIELRKLDLLYEMSDSELSSTAVGWNYKDLLRNSQDYSEKLIFVEGVVKNTQREYNMITLYVNCDTEPEVICYNSERMFVHLKWDDKSWLEDDQLRGFVKVSDPSETGSFSDTTGEFIGSGDYIPSTHEIRLTCSNC
jgi:hypothetical protein